MTGNLYPSLNINKIEGPVMEGIQLQQPKRDMLPFLEGAEG